MKEPPQGSFKQLGLGVTWKTKPVPNTEHLLEVTATKVLSNHHSKIVKNQSLHTSEIYIHTASTQIYSLPFIQPQ